MAKTERIKEKPKQGVRKRIDDMIQKYGDVITLVRDVDRRPGSPTQFKVDYNRMIFWLALAGMTEPEMANVLGVPDTTFAFWKKTRPDFLAALQSGKMEAVGVAAHSLFRVATGYTHEAVKLIPNRVREYNPNTGKIQKEYTEVIHEPYTKHYPPNVTALLKFLAAKYPEVWGDRSEVVHSGTVTHSIDASKLTKKQLKTLKKIAESSIESEKTEENDEQTADK